MVLFTDGGVSNRQVTMQECKQRALFTKGQETSVQETNGGEKILRENFQDFYQRVERDGYPVASCQPVLAVLRFASTSKVMALLPAGEWRCQDS